MEDKITIFDVADWFLSKETMTHKKLQKLCYYAQAWYCALYDGTPLFDEEIQAWVHGPVCPDLWAKYREYKWDKIPQVESCRKFDEKELDILEAVYDNYIEMSGAELEELTHIEEPWKKTRGGLPPYENCTRVISIIDMRDYYKRKYEEDQND